jgi:hypothetical protein
MGTFSYTLKCKLQPLNCLTLIGTEGPLDDIPEHLFRVWEVYDDCISGYSLTGPLEGVYGEPGLELILRVHSRST